MTPEEQIAQYTTMLAEVRDAFARQDIIRGAVRQCLQQSLLEDLTYVVKTLLNVNDFLVARRAEIGQTMILLLDPVTVQPTLSEEARDKAWLDAGYTKEVRNGVVIYTGPAVNLDQALNSGDGTCRP